MVKILITGGAGFIFSSLADKLLQDENNYVVLVDNLLTGNIANIPKHKNCKFIKCDANNYAELSAIMTAHDLIMFFIMLQLLVCSVLCKIR
ncbi:MAG: GDP-mannose 4,6-dehydratase [Chitinophagales bacterium]